MRDQLVTLLLAGHETTATALAWTLHELSRSREQLARARKAADDGDDAYLEAVLKESMRLHPVIPMVVRLLMQPATVGFFFQAEDGIRDGRVTGVQTCALPIWGCCTEPATGAPFDYWMSTGAGFGCETVLPSVRPMLHLMASKYIF